MAQAKDGDRTTHAGSKAAWSAEVARVLRGAPMEKLVRRTLDGPAIRPLYTQSDVPPPRPLPLQPGGQRGASLGFGWSIVQRHDLADPIQANRAILEDLANGVSGIMLAIDSSFATGGACPDGIVILDHADLEAVLDGVMLDLAPLIMDAGPRALELAPMVLDIAGRGEQPTLVSLGVDPVGCLAHGLTEAAETEIAAAAGLAQRAGPSTRIFRADGRRWHDAGASDAQELAYTLATAIHYLRCLEAAGWAPDEGAAHIELAISVDDDLMAGLAKLRAARLLWGRIQLACGIAEPMVDLHAQTARRMQTRSGAHLNILRATIATFAAACGGADRITVLPFDAAIGPGDGFSRRIARNVQIILAEESNIFRTLDPAAGSYAIESMTAELAALAWGKLQAIEAMGGIVPALRAGVPQQEIAAVVAERRKLVATRRMPITGVSEFPELEPQLPPSKLPDMQPFLTAAAQRRGSAKARPVPPIPTIRAERLAEPFERLRERAAAHRSRVGDWPRLLLATIGIPAEHTERANWAQNLLAAGGIEAVPSGPLADAEAAAAALEGSGLEVVALCASDAVYALLAESAARALNAAGAKRIFLMGRPPAELEPVWRAAGIDGFAHVGIDVVAWLEMVQAVLGIGDQDGGTAS